MLSVLCGLRLLLAAAIGSKLWLNGRHTVSADTHLVSGRYGCSERVDGTRADQLIVDLDLQQGENCLLVRMTLADEPSFYFSPSPDPVPRLWDQIRRDFPAAQNPLLDLVHASWLETSGWFAASGSELEEQLVDRLAADCGDHGAMIRAELGRLKQRKRGRTKRVGSICAPRLQSSRR